MACSCPICHGEAAPRAVNKAAPFCSPRCKLLDLGHWLNESYSVPASDPSEGGLDSLAEENA